MSSSPFTPGPEIPTDIRRAANDDSNSEVGTKSKVVFKDPEFKNEKYAAIVELAILREHDDGHDSPLRALAFPLLLGLPVGLVLTPSLQLPVVCVGFVVAVSMGSIQGQLGEVSRAIGAFLASTTVVSVLSLVAPTFCLQAGQ